MVVWPIIETPKSRLASKAVPVAGLSQELQETDQGLHRAAGAGLRYREIAAVLGMSLGGCIDIAGVIRGRVNPCGLEIKL
jgi:hypothetical protein